MPRAEHSPIRVGQADGVLTYLIDLAPEALPAVRPRDLAAAWEAARAGAIAERWGPPRLFRFRRPDGSANDLALADPDATAWAGAIDSIAALATPAGLSLCLRLLALVDLLATAPWAGALFALRRDGAELDPRLLRAAATGPLTDTARFDAERLRAALPPSLPAPPPGARPATGATP